jgi:PAT family beta-lactamase induction signal transducer AmpG
MTRPQLLRAVALLYIAQGLPPGIVHELVPVWLKSEGVSNETLGAMSLLSIPWAAKALWAPLVDRHGSPRQWIGASLALIGLCTVALPFLPRGGPLFFGALFGIALASATQDIAIDGWTAAVTPPVDQGRMNGVRVAAYRGVSLVVGSGAVALGAYVDWSVLLIGVGLLCLPLIAVTGVMVEAPRAPSQPIGVFLGDLWRWLLGQGPGPAAALVAFLLLYKLGDAAMGPMVKPFWMDAGLSVSEVGLVSVGIGTALTVGGALLGGEIIARIGLYPSLWALGGGAAVSNLVYALVALGPSRAGVYLASGVESLTTGMGTAAFLAFLTRATAGEQAGTRFALLTSVGLLARSLSGAVSGYATAAWGYPAWFALTFVLALPGLLLLPALRPRVEAGAQMPS